MAGGFILFAPLTGRAVGRLPESNVSRGARYNPALVKDGTSAQAVSLCIRAAQKDAETRGRIMGIDIQSVEQIKRGFDVRGSIMIKHGVDNRTATADFRCKTQRSIVTQLTVGKLRGATD